MAIFIVKTINDRNLVLEAAKFKFDTINRAYEFTDENGSVVASLPGGDVFAVLKDTVEQADFYSRDEWGPNDEAADLLERAVDIIIEHEVGSGDDHEFWRDYFDFTGEHMVLTDEGWEPGEVKQSYGPDDIHEELNAPEETHE